MILTLRSLNESVHIDITADQFKRLRDTSIATSEIYAIASECGCNAKVLEEYVKDLKKTNKEIFEIDGSCDYSDHL